MGGRSRAESRRSGHRCGAARAGRHRAQTPLRCSSRRGKHSRSPAPHEQTFANTVVAAAPEALNETTEGRRREPNVSSCLCGTEVRDRRRRPPRTASVRTLAAQRVDARAGERGRSRRCSRGCALRYRWVYVVGVGTPRRKCRLSNDLRCDRQRKRHDGDEAREQERPHKPEELPRERASPRGQGSPMTRHISRQSNS